jgi:hypothetical protein
MARRIVLAILALICALLGTVFIPLGLITASHDRQDFRQQALTAARSLASVAEEKLGDSEHGTALTAAIAQIRGDGDQVTVNDREGTAHPSRTPPDPPELAPRRDTTPPGQSACTATPSAGRSCA